MVLPITGAESYVPETGKSMKVETVAVTVSLHSEAEANLFGLYWRPLYELKLGRCKVLRVLADYASAMFSLLFCFPAILCGWRRSSPEPPWAGRFCVSPLECYSPEEN